MLVRLVETGRFLSNFPSDTAARVKALVPGRNKSFSATVDALCQSPLLVYTDWELDDNSAEINRLRGDFDQPKNPC